MKPTDDDIPCVTYDDRCRLGQLLDREDSCAWGGRLCRANLEVILEQAEPVDARDAADNLVTMNTSVRLTDLHSKQRRTVTLVYPDDVDLASNGISILEPLGTALLGRMVGDVIQCPAEKCQKQFRIDEVARYPEHV